MKIKRKMLVSFFAGVVLLSSCSETSDPEQTITHIDRSETYQEQGQYRAALIEVRNAIQEDPDNVEYILYYANLLIEVGTPNQAEEVLKEHQDKIDEIRLVLVRALLKQAKYISAKQYLQNWKENEEEELEYLRLSALQLYLSGNREESLKQYQHLSKREDATIELQNEYISLLIENTQYDTAQEMIAQLIQKVPNDPNLLYLQALLAEKQNKLELAERSLTEALSYLPSTDIMLDQRLKVLELLSSVLTRLGQPDVAFTYNKIIREANPEAFVAKQQYKDALVAASKGDLATAKAAFEDILTQFPNNQQAALLLGLIHLEEGDLGTGEALLTENIDAEIAPVTIIRATALAQAEQGKPDSALAVLEKALLARPDDITLLSLYGVISLNNQQEQQGLQSISKALELDPNRTRLRLLLAQYYVEQENYEMALGHLRKAYQQNPADWPTTSFYLSLLLRTEEKEEAINVKDDLLLSYSDNESALWVLSMTEYQLGNIQRSTEILVELNAKVPDNIQVVNALGRLYTQENEYDLAAEMWLQGIKIDPNNRNFLNSLIQSKAMSLTPLEMSDYLLEQAAANPQIALPLNSAAVELLVTQGKMDVAQKIAAEYENSTQPYAKVIQANILRGEATQLADNEQWKQALEKARLANQVLEGNTALLLLQARLEAKNDNAEHAINILTEALAQNPNNIPLINEKAILLARFKTPEQALSYLRPIWNDKPHGALANVYLGLVHRLESSQLETALNQLLEVDPNNAGALYTVAALKQSNGEAAAAIAYYEKALSINANLVQALNNLAWLLRETDSTTALKYAQRAAELAPNSAAVLDTYGLILHLNGLNDEAIRVLDQALLLEPDNEEIKAHRAQVSE